MASPVVAGMATLIRGMYPEFNAAQVKQIIVLSSVKYDEKVTVQERRKRNTFLRFPSLEVVNLYTALSLAQSIRDRATGKKQE